MQAGRSVPIDQARTKDRALLVEHLLNEFGLGPNGSGES